MKWNVCMWTIFAFYVFQHTVHVLHTYQIFEVPIRLLNFKCENAKNVQARSLYWLT